MVIIKKLDNILNASNNNLINVIQYPSGAFELKYYKKFKLCWQCLPFTHITIQVNQIKTTVNHNKHLIMIQPFIWKYEYKYIYEGYFDDWFENYFTDEFDRDWNKKYRHGWNKKLNYLLLKYIHHIDQSNAQEFILKWLNII